VTEMVSNAIDKKPMGLVSPRAKNVRVGPITYHKNRRKAMTFEPVNISQEELEIIGRLDISQPIISIATSDDGKRVYFGQPQSYDRNRLNLAVLSLDDTGKPIGKIRRYADSKDISFSFGDVVSISKILVSSKYKKLYLGFNQQNAKGTGKCRGLSVYDLDNDGEPTGQPRSYIYPLVFAKSFESELIEAIELHPDKDLLYLSGFGATGVYVYSLDAKGEPQGIPMTYIIGSAAGKVEIGINNNILYLGSYPDILEVIELGVKGLPINPIAIQTVPAGTLDKYDKYVHFQRTPTALYWLEEPPLPTSPGYEIKYLLLDGVGKPIGLPQTVPGFKALTLAADPMGNTIWISSAVTIPDAFTLEEKVVGYVPFQLILQNDGSLILDDIAHERVYEQNPLLTIVPPGQSPVTLSNQIFPNVNQVKDYHLVLTPVANPNTPIQLLDVKIEIGFGKRSTSINQVLNQGIPSKAISLDRLWRDEENNYILPLKDLNSQQIFRVVVAAPLLTEISLTINVYLGDPVAGGTLIKSLLSDTALGNMLCLLLPGYGFMPPGQREINVEWLSSHVSDRYLTTARSVAIAAAERPQQFTISCYNLLGGQGHIQQLEDQANTISLIGINNAGIDYWKPIPTTQIDSILDSYGLQQRLIGVGQPLTIYNGLSTIPNLINEIVPKPDFEYFKYFDFIYNKRWQEFLVTWAEEIATVSGITSGGNPADVTVMQLTEEPIWYYPDLINRTNANSDWLDIFRTYLQSKGFSPYFFGQPDWDLVLMIGASNAIDLTSNRLFYWSMRYLTESASLGNKRAHDELKKFLPNAAIYVNWNNYQSNWYTPTPNTTQLQRGNNPDGGADSAAGSFDWMESGRLNAHTIWSENADGYDTTAQEWSYRADLLRSASMLGTQKFGAHINGNHLRKNGATFIPLPAAASYRALSLIGHGAKILDFYGFGHSFFFPAAKENTWSDMPASYGSIAEATKLIGKAENLLFNGQPQRGKVALLLSNVSNLWDTNSRDKYYSQELLYLHTALVHTGYTIDFVDDTDLIDGQLSVRGYSVLYMTSPNIDEAAQTAILNWVQSGGMLVATPGAAVADRYNTPTNFLDVVLGLNPRVAVRDAIGNPVATPSEVLSSFGGTLEIAGPIQTLQATPGTSIVGTFGSGEPAITSHSFGTGNAITYGFFPGLQYWVSQYVESPVYNNPHALPKWGKAERQIAVAPARLAKTPRPVTLSHEVFEACRLESSKGIAIVLLNWTGEPIPALTVTVPDIGMFTNTVKLADGTVINHSTLGTTLTVIVSMQYVDVLMIE
jgi:Beta-galactosidase trimerisation domain